MVDPRSSTAKHWHECRGHVDRLASEVPEASSHEDPGMPSVLCKASGGCVIAVRMLSPPASRVQAIEVVAASLLCHSVEDRLLRGEALVMKVVVHVNALVNLHNVNELVSAPLVGNPGDPVTTLRARSLVIWCAHRQRAGAPKRIGRQAGIVPHHIRVEIAHECLALTFSTGIP